MTPLKIGKIMDDVTMLQVAISAGVNSALNGGGPFGAVIARVNETGDIEQFVDNNHVTENNDPTAHAEVSVIRKACSALGTFDLSGWVLFSSCEPCPMCLGAALWSRVDRIVFAADRHDAAGAGFDDLAFYELMDKGGVAEHIIVDNPIAPFQAWDDNTNRTEY